MKKTVNLLFSATSDYLPYAVVTAVSAKENLNSDYGLKVYFMYADIVKTITDYERQVIFEYANATLKKHDIEIEYINIKDNVHLFEGQNTGMWGEAISFTHYLYLLAPIYITDIDKVIYIDTDMIVNCDLSQIYNIDMSNYLITMGAPRGFEEMGDDVSNSGFLILNLKQWREEKTLNKLLEFGKTIPKCNFCDQNLLYQYFTKRNKDRLMLVEKEYNIFPQLFPEIELENIKILHYTGWKHEKPWKDNALKQRGGFLWWRYARKTEFYEYFLLKNIPDPTQKRDSFWKRNKK